MDWLMIIVIIILLIVILALLWKNYRTKKEVERFAGQVENAIDAIVTGREWDVDEQLEDSLWGRTGTQLAIFRRRNIGFVFQAYNLVPDLNVYENVILPIELDGRKVDIKYVNEILELLGMSDKKNVLPGMLSGGQQQRTAIARALATKPSIILADEPTGNLDSVTSHEVLGLLKMVAKQFRQTIILITHDRDIAQLADRIVHIEDGRIIGDTEKGCDIHA